MKVNSKLVVGWWIYLSQKKRTEMYSKLWMKIEKAQVSQNEYDNDKVTICAWLFLAFLSLFYMFIQFQKYTPPKRRATAEKHRNKNDGLRWMLVQRMSDVFAYVWSRIIGIYSNYNKKCRDVNAYVTSIPLPIAKSSDGFSLVDGFLLYFLRSKRPIFCFFFCYFARAQHVMSKWVQSTESRPIVHSVEYEKPTLVWHRPYDAHKLV